MSKNVQMPESFLTNVYRLIDALQDYELDLGTKDILKVIENQINSKIEALERREVFTKYKTASPGSDEREAARKKYLDKVGVHKDWQTAKETPL